jgi:hypothetical protein
MVFDHGGRKQRLVYIGFHSFISAVVTRPKVR